jgi:PAS domain S-box-containing protein
MRGSAVHSARNGQSASGAPGRTSMTSRATRGRGSLPGRTLAGRASPTARLALVEILLASEDSSDCASETLDWLARHTRVSKAICGVVDPESAHCTTIAVLGVEPTPDPFTVVLDRMNEPLAAALAAMRPTYFPVGARQPSTPLGHVPFHAIPLRTRSATEELAVGLLLVEAEDAQVPTDLLWSAGVLGEKIARLSARRSLVEAKYVRERTLLDSLLNTVADPIMLTDIEGKVIIANARAERLFLSRDEESEGRRRAIGMNNMLFSAAVSNIVFEAGESTRTELLLVDPTEGSDLLFELMAHVVKDPMEGTSVVAILRNVTDLGRAAMEIEVAEKKLRAAEADIRAQRHRLELIIDSVADPIVVTDPAGEILLMNDPAEKILSIPDDAGAEQLRRVRGNEAHFSSFVSNLLFGGHDEQRYRGEINMVVPSDGEFLPVEAVAGKILSEQGELNAVVTILHDRREAMEKARLYEQLKKASEQLEVKVQEATGELANQNELLRRQAFELERASAAKSQFLANMSHELRTPLNAMLGYTSMLLQGVSGELAPPQKQKLSRVEANGRNLLAIINEILDITRIEAGRMPLNVTEFDVGDLVNEVVGELESVVSRSKLDVRVEVPKRLPKVRSDRQKVKQIVLNLFGNALKFTREGRVTISAKASEGMVGVAVEDTGIGIASEHHERVFEDFQQVDSSPTRQYGGTGLGLAICRRLARVLDGEIALDSHIGKGSTFTLTIPTRLKRR